MSTASACLRRALITALCLGALVTPGCVHDVEDEGADGLEPEDLRDNEAEMGLMDCTERQDTGYTRGSRFAISVVTADGRPVEVDTGNAYFVMQQAAARDGVGLRIVSGFRTNAEQQRLYSCYVNCNCNSCNLAASPGYSNHQSGHALDLNTSDAGVLSWLNRRGEAFGFRRTVPSEAWHWEWWGGGPGGGPCRAPAPAPPPPPAVTFETLEGDFDGDGTSDLATITKDALGGWRDWVSVELSTGGAFVSQAWAAATPAHMRNGGKQNDYRVVVGDFNGDGRSDLATLSKNGGGGWRDWVALELSTGSGFTSRTWAAATPAHMRNGGSDKAYAVRVGDFNGDGRDDLAIVSPNAAGGWRDWASLELSTGSGFVSSAWPMATSAHMRNGGSDKSYDVFAADVDGDGKSDLATVSKDAGGAWRDWVAVELSTGAGFTSRVWPAATPMHMRNGGIDRRYDTRVGDFNGDGRADLATLSKDGGGAWRDWVAVELSTGAGFTSRAWPASTPAHMRNGGSDRAYAVRVGDVNGDGNDDLLTVTKDGGGGWRDWAAVEVSTGSGFTSRTWAAATPLHMRNGGGERSYETRVGDFDGDGLADLATISQNGGGGWRSFVAVEQSTGAGFRSATWSAATPTHMRNGTP